MSITNNFFIVIILCCIEKSVVTNDEIKNSANDLIMVFGLNNGQLLKAKIDQPTNTYPLTDFSNLSKVAALARFEDYIFASTETSYLKAFRLSNLTRLQFANLRSLYRCKILNSTDFSILHSICEEFDGLGYFRSVSSMVMMNSTLFIAFTNGEVIRCSANQPHSCEETESINISKDLEKITGIDFNPNDGQLYVSSSSGKLWRRSINSKDSLLTYPWYILLFSTNYDGFTSMKIAFDAIWIGTDKGELIKCLVSSNDKIDCLVFDKFYKNAIVSMNDFNGFLYIHLENNNICRCNPSENWKCRHLFSTPNGSLPFMLI